MTPVDSLDPSEAPEGYEARIGFTGTYMHKSSSGGGVEINIDCIGYFDEEDEELYYMWRVFPKLG